MNTNLLAIYIYADKHAPHKHKPLFSRLQSSQTSRSDTWGLVPSKSQQSVPSPGLHVALTTRLPSQDVDAQDEESTGTPVAVLTVKHRDAEGSEEKTQDDENDSETSRCQL